MAKLRTERHHWWPECLSAFWKNDEGCVHRIDADGNEFPAPPKNFGGIRNGHNVKLGNSPGETTPWDESFERDFDQADSNFIAVIAWLEQLEREGRFGLAIPSRFVPQAAEPEKCEALVEGLISLAVRSPMTRESAVGLAERFRGPLPDRERNAIIGLNMRHGFRNTMATARGRGKIVVFYSPDREFIFGDGFFNTVHHAGQNSFGVKLLVPLTPSISALYVQPQAYRPDPRLFTFVLDRDEAKLLNDTAQVYAKQELFYRSERPELTDEFRQQQHLHYSSPRNTIDSLIDQIPGVQPRDLSFSDALAGMPDIGLFGRRGMDSKG